MCNVISFYFNVNGQFFLSLVFAYSKFLRLVSDHQFEFYFNELAPFIDDVFL